MLVLPLLSLQTSIVLSGQYEWQTIGDNNHWKVQFCFDGHSALFNEFENGHAKLRQGKLFLLYLCVFMYQLCKNNSEQYQPSSANWSTNFGLLCNCS